MQNRLFAATLFSALLMSVPPLRAQDFGVAPQEVQGWAYFAPRRLYLDLPLLEMPYQQQAMVTTGGWMPSYMNPGMGFSTTLSNDLYLVAHWGLQQIPYSSDARRSRTYTRWAIYGFDLVSTWLPLGYAWLHEEYHRSVMTWRGVNSFNEVLLFKVGSTVISVSRETDEEMAMLCDTYHPDFLRLMAAGHEGQTQQNVRMQRNDFFYHQRLDNELILLNNALNNTAYLATCAFGLGDEDVEAMNAVETDVASRDFTGMDMMAWAYGLFHPDERYADRGTHPTGVGINRYIVTDQLGEEAVAYLRRQTALDLLNCVSPLMVGFSHINLGLHGNRQYYGNFALRHYLTPFGDDNCAELLLQAVGANGNWPLNVYTVLHNYNNYHHHFGGLEAGVVDAPLWGGRLLAGVTGQLWWQPEGMSFFTDASAMGGSAALRLTLNTARCPSAGPGRCNPYIEAGYKSAGWQAGIVTLEQDYTLMAGILWSL